MLLSDGLALRMMELRSSQMVSASSVFIPVNVDDRRSISENITEKHDSSHDKLRKQYAGCL